MSDIVKDRIFGEMCYKHAWIKMQEVMLFGKRWQIKIMAAAYTGERICEEQRLGYCYFGENLSEISGQCTDILLQYVSTHRDDFSARYPRMKDLRKETIAEFVSPRTALFAREGSVILLFDVRWDEENGIGIEVYPDVRVGLQDDFL